MNEEQRYRIIEELEDLLELDEAPPIALSMPEMMKMLGIGRVRLQRALDELDRQGKLYKAKVKRTSPSGHPYWTWVYWFEDDD